MLTSWALGFNAWKKHLAWYAYQQKILEEATLFHVTAADEAGALRALGLSQPVAVIPNGVEIPASIPSESESEKRRALFLSRIHPKKGLPLLLDAWEAVRPEGWALEIVGPSESGHREDLEQQAQDLGVEKDVHFTGPVRDEDKWKKYAAADLFILPSHSENFGIVVAEALAAGVPVITTQGTPWAELREHDCGWWVDLSVDTLASTLQSATSIPAEERWEMGRRGRKLVQDQYSWKSVADRMIQAYRWLLEGGSRPECIENGSLKTPSQTIPAS